jgi:SAM-dependent methyltransferase
MKNQDKWAPTKFVKNKKGKFIGTHMHRALGPAYEKNIREISSGDLLDLGCGSVPLYDFYREKTTSITCIDWESTEHKQIHIDIFCDLTKPIPLPDNSFDTIICTDVLEHIPVPYELMKEISRLLRPGGKLFLAVPFYYCLHEEPHDYFRYTKHALTRFCTENKLRVLKIEEYGGAPEIIVDVMYKTYDFLNLPARKFVLRMSNRISSFMLSSKIARKISRMTAKHFPLGYVVVAQKNQL